MFKWALGIFSQLFPSREEETDPSLLQAAGPVSVLCTVIVSLLNIANIDLIFVAIIGLALCFGATGRGLIYSLILLVIDALIKHAFFIDWHLWQIGIETSLAVGWAMTAASTEWRYRKERTLIAQSESKRQTVSNLEEDLEKARQDALGEQIAMQERLSNLQKDLDESLSEASSLQILNDVLRKTAAQTCQEREEIGQKYLEKEEQAATLLGEIEQLKQESSLLMETIAEREFDLNRLQEQMHELTAHESSLLERISVFDRELNAAKAERETSITKLIEAEKALNEQKERISVFDRELNAAKAESETSITKLIEAEKALNEQKERLSVLDRELNAARSDREMGATKLFEAEKALAEQVAKQTGIDNEHWAEKLHDRDQALSLLQERLQAFAHKEAQYQELKKQFDEKNKVLHQTRTELFQADTALQAMRLDQERQNFTEPPIAEQKLFQELADSEKENETLEKENTELLDLISLLSKEDRGGSEKILERLTQTDAVKKKPKKKKKKTVKKAEEKPLFQTPVDGVSVV